MDSIPVLITWGFNPSNGKLELDCFLELNNPKHAEAVGHIYLRAGVHNHSVALLHIQTECATRKFVEEWMGVGDSESVVGMLKKAKVHQNDIVRKKNDVNSVDFILGS